MDDQTDIHRLADALIANAADLELELDWLANVLHARLLAYFAEPSQSPPMPTPELAPPDLSASNSPYADFLREHDLTPGERLLLLLALVPHVRPQQLDVLLTRNEVTQRGFTEFGGVPNSVGAFLPTGETAIFLLAGDELTERLNTARMLEPTQRLTRLEVLQSVGVMPGDSVLNAPLQLSPRFIGLVTRGQPIGPAFDQHFPARRVHTQMEWEDLVLPESTFSQLEEIGDWLQHGQTLLHEWGMGQRLRPGYTSLFFGPPGTGKTLAACLLGKRCGREVYKIDLSMVVSKYIGETEKNLARVFDQAEHRGWLLFFDEADALFGKRTRVDDSHDRYANQEVSFLLQRIEEFDGVVILASNLKSNIDDAFLRRFQSVIHFPMPKSDERLRIWREAFPSKARLDAGLNLPRLAERHELSGGIIMNVARYAALRTLARADTDATILAIDVEEGIRRELAKEGRAF